MTTFGSLFSGIGGLDLGLERAGWEPRWQVENDPWCRRVLARHWPDVPRYGDVREVGAELEPVDLICGGFPCQPVSTAGRRLAQADERWLWPECARIVRLLRPRLVLVENVPGLLARGMGDVLGDLAESGYDAEWDCIPAAAFGAPHLRYRVVIVAHAQGEPGSLRAASGERSGGLAGGGPAPHAERGQLRDEPGRVGGARGAGASVAGNDGPQGSLAHAEGEPVGAGLRESGSRGVGGRRPSNGGRSGPYAGRVRLEGIFQGGPAAGPALGDGGWWATEPDVGRVAHGVPARVDRLRGLGNAVVPQLAEWIGRRLMETAP